MAKIDRRMFTRYEVRMGAYVMTSKYSFGAEMIDISLVGVRLRALQAVNPGTRLSVRMDLPEKIIFHGKVVWVLGTITQELHHYVIGIETDAMEISNTKARGLSERTELLQEILYSIKEQAVGAIF